MNQSKGWGKVIISKGNKAHYFVKMKDGTYRTECGKHYSANEIYLADDLIERRCSMCSQVAY